MPENTSYIWSLEKKVERKDKNDKSAGRKEIKIGFVYFFCIIHRQQRKPDLPPFKQWIENSLSTTN